MRHLQSKSLMALLILSIMKNRITILLLLIPMTSFSQNALDSARKVDVYIDKASTYNDAALHESILIIFKDILHTNDIYSHPDSAALNRAIMHKRNNAISHGNTQNRPKETSSQYVIKVDTLGHMLQLSVNVTEVNILDEIKSKQCAVPLDLFFNNKKECTELVTYEVANALGLLGTSELKDTLDSLIRWKTETIQKAQSATDSEKRKYTALSFLPPVNQFRSHTSKGTANGAIILTGYGVSVGAFIWSTTAYAANKRKLENISVDISEADKAKEYYKGQMDISRGGQIASGILFAASYIYGVANALANRDSYQKKISIAISPAVLDNGAGIALVYKF